MSVNNIASTFYGNYKECVHTCDSLAGKLHNASSNPDAVERLNKGQVQVEFDRLKNMYQEQKSHLAKIEKPIQEGQVPDQSLSTLSELNEIYSSVKPLLEEFEHLTSNDDVSFVQELIKAFNGLTIEQKNHFMAANQALNRLGLYFSQKTEKTASSSTEPKTLDIESIKKAYKDNQTKMHELVNGPNRDVSTELAGYTCTFKKSKTDSELHMGGVFKSKMGHTFKVTAVVSFQGQEKILGEGRSKSSWGNAIDRAMGFM